MRTRWWALSSLVLIFLALAAWGCTASSNKEPEATTQTGASSGDKEPSKPDETKEPEKTADRSEIPGSLKGDAFAYYGLGSDKVLEFEVIPPEGEPMTGTQTMVYKGMKDGKALFTLERTGSLANTLGSQEMELSDKGLFVTSVSNGTMDKPSLELPLTLTPGAKWQSDQTLTVQDQTISSKATYVVKGLEKVKTKGGEFDAMLVTANGTVTQGSVTTPLSMNGWYAKGLGMVKSEVVTKPKKGESKRVVIELVKQ